MNFGSSSGDDPGGKSNLDSEYYCDVCDSNMHNLDVWEKHIAGKKHTKNLKKASIEKPAEVKSVVKDITSYIQRQLDMVDVPVIGLNHIVEINSAKPNSEPSYRCNLCQASGEPRAIIGHIISTRHRLNHMKEADSENYNMIETLVLMKGSKDSLVEEKATLLEQKEGRGKIEVRLEVVDPSKRNHFRLGFEQYGGAKPPHFAEAEMQLPPRPPHPVGHELIGNTRFLPFGVKLRMLEDLSTVRITSELEANVVVNSMKILHDRVMKFKSSAMYPVPRASNFPAFRGPPRPPVQNFNTVWQGQNQDGYWKRVTF